MVFEKVKNELVIRGVGTVGKVRIRLAARVDLSLSDIDDVFTLLDKSLRLLRHFSWSRCDRWFLTRLNLVHFLRRAGAQR